jgi:hypothetical protein
VFIGLPDIRVIELENPLSQKMILNAASKLKITFIHHISTAIVGLSIGI